RLRLDAGVVERFRLGRAVDRLADQPIDRHPVGDRAQPAGEGGRLAKLADLLHRLDEDVLAELLGLTIVAEPAQSDGHHVPLEALEQVAKRLPVAALRGLDQLGQLGLVVAAGGTSRGVQRDGVHGKLSKTAYEKRANAPTRPIGTVPNRPGAGIRGYQGMAAKRG